MEADYVKWLAQNPAKADRGSIAGRAVIERSTIHIPDVLADPEYTRLESQKRGRHRSLLGVPLLREGVPIGVIALHRTEVRPFTNKQIELVTTFADQAVIAIENVRLFEEVQARTRELSKSLQQQTATADVLKAISRSTFNLQAVLNTLVKSAARLCDADRGIAYRREGATYKITASYGFSREFHEFQEVIRSSQDAARLSDERQSKEKPFIFPMCLPTRNIPSLSRRKSAATGLSSPSHYYDKEIRLGHCR